MTPQDLKRAEQEIFEKNDGLSYYVHFDAHNMTVHVGDSGDV